MGLIFGPILFILPFLLYFWWQNYKDRQRKVDIGNLESYLEEFIRILKLEGYKIIAQSNDYIKLKEATPYSIISLRIELKKTHFYVEILGKGLFDDINLNEDYIVGFNQVKTVKSILKQLEEDLFGGILD